MYSTPTVDEERVTEKIIQKVKVTKEKMSEKLAGKGEAMDSEGDETGCV